MQEGATPLVDATFVVIDLETTGCEAGADRITEIGALKLCGGERVGTFQTLIDPGCPIPARITGITGIHDGMVHNAPSVAAVLPSLIEFVGDAVVVGHNVSFDLRFLHADLAALDYLPIANGCVDTLALARILVRDEVRDCRLGTLAGRFATAATPDHRAFSDAAATAELFHALIERVTSFGVIALDDLLAFPRVGGHPEAAKLRWVGSLPRSPGVFSLCGRDGDPLFIGAAEDLRSDVRSLFEVRRRTGVWAALHLAASLVHEVSTDAAAAERLAAARVEEESPPFNRRQKISVVRG